MCENHNGIKKFSDTVPALILVNNALQASRNCFPYEIETFSDVATRSLISSPNLIFQKLLNAFVLPWCRQIRKK